MTTLLVLFLCTFWTFVLEAQDYENPNIIFDGGDLSHGIGYFPEFIDIYGNVLPQIGYQTFSRRFWDYINKYASQNDLEILDQTNAWISVDYFTGSNENLVSCIDRNKIDENDELTDPVEIKNIKNKNIRVALAILLKGQKKFREFFFCTITKSFKKNRNKKIYFVIPPSFVVQAYAKSYLEAIGLKVIYDTTKGKIEKNLESINTVLHQLEKSSKYDLALIDMNQWVLKPKNQKKYDPYKSILDIQKQFSWNELLEVRGSRYETEVFFSEDFQLILLHVLIEAMNKEEELQLPSPL
ncbi:MAG: hypothetical protein KDD52_06465 [Bdellovibrionales bacterium]|nr:hypothetical protein [Bdellovibrionales bacterium]